MPEKSERSAQNRARSEGIEERRIKKEEVGRPAIPISAIRLSCKNHVQRKEDRPEAVTGEVKS